MGAFLGGGVTGKTLSEDDAATALSQPDNACRADETHQCIDDTLHSGAMHRGAGGDWPGCRAGRSTVDRRVRRGTGNEGRGCG